MVGYVTCRRERRKAAVSAIVGAAFGAAGQRCMALSAAVLVGDAGHWAKDIAEGASKLKVREPLLCFLASTGERNPV